MSLNEEMNETFNEPYIDMLDEELPYEHQLEEIAVRINWFRDDNIPPESYLSPTFLKYLRIICSVTGITNDLCQQ